MEQKVEMGPFDQFKVGSGTLCLIYQLNLNKLGNQINLLDEKNPMKQFAIEYLQK